MTSLEKSSPRLSQVFGSGCVPWEEAWPGGGVDAFTLTPWCPGSSGDLACVESPPTHSGLWNAVLVLLYSLHWGAFHVCPRPACLSPWHMKNMFNSLGLVSLCLGQHIPHFMCSCVFLE